MESSEPEKPRRWSAADLDRMQTALFDVMIDQIVPSMRLADRADDAPVRDKSKNAAIFGTVTTEPKG